jgi:hypothetical protein
MINVGDILTVATAGAITSNGALLAAGFHGDVVAVTEKAVKLAATTEKGAEIEAWFPKKAFNKITDRGNFGNQPAKTTTLARWFNPTGWTARYIELTTESSTLRG